ncbi:MAG: nitroreductase family protein [Gemmatales bacterium]|nr:nitroreductase family protein [Gemmatales bacterium]MDW8175021.1 nitroreductase family protein [Gemmatales bacterium]
MSEPTDAIWYQTFSRAGRRPTLDEVVRLAMARPGDCRLLSRPIPDNLPVYLLEAARWVPYRSPQVPIEAIIVRDADHRQVLTEVSGLGEMVGDAPVWLVIAARWQAAWWQRYCDPWREWAMRALACDVGMAVLMMILAAQSVQVQAIPVWQFSHRRVHKTFGIPRKYPLFCLMALGYGEPLSEAGSLPKSVTLFAHGELW